MLWFAYFLAVVNAVIIGLSFLFIKVAVSHASPIDTLSFRFIVALVFCVIYMKLAKIPMRIDFKRLLPLLLLAVFYPLGFFTFQAYGVQHISSAEVGILTATAPVITAICAALFIGEKNSPMQFVSILVSVSGVMLISVMTGSGFDVSSIAGIVLILLSCFMSAGYTITNRVLVRSFTAMEITLVLMIVGAVFFSVLSLTSHAVNGTLSLILQPLGNWHFTMAILYLGIFSSMLTTIFASLILKRLRAAQLIVFLNLSIIIAMITGYFFMDESIYSYHVIAAALIILGVLGTNFFPNPEKQARKNS
jgi:drug/metabolite transporter (DMT)-like permease